MSFSFEKLLSASATVTGRVRLILRAVHKFGYISKSFLPWTNVSSKSKDMVFDGKSGKFFSSCASPLPSKSDYPLKYSVVLMFTHCSASSTDVYYLFYFTSIFFYLFIYKIFSAAHAAPPQIPPWAAAHIAHMRNQPCNRSPIDCKSTAFRCFA